MDSTVTTRACTQFSRSPSSSPANRSMHVICTAKASAQPVISKSPLLICVTPTQLSRYSPITAIATLNTMVNGGFCPRNIPSTGTQTMYMAVRKPAFPASVYTSPTCCRLVATNRAQPQMRPTFQRVGFFHFFADSRTLHDLTSIRKEQGIRNSTASAQRTD